MSKVIKQMQMDAIRKAFEGVRDLVVVSIKGLTCHADHALRAKLRKKDIRMQVMKNSLARRVFSEVGLAIPDDSPYWIGPTAFVWGANSIAEVSQALDGELRAPKTAALYKDKVVIKGAVAEGQPLPFEQALKMPTRLEAIGAILSAILGPGSAIAGCLTGPASQIASQIQKISEKEPPAEAAAPATEAAPAPAATS
jgi:large subunit ribosomal protein L10